MILHDELLVIAAASGLYLYDSILLLYRNQGLLEFTDRDGWRVILGSRSIELGGKELIFANLLAPQRPNSAKQAPYECGIVPEQEPAERFPVKFYLVAMSFIVLDVEIVFLYPFSVVFRGLGAFGLFAMATFVLTLLVPFAYLLSVGALEWGPVKDVLQRMPGPLLRTGNAVYAPGGEAGEHTEEAA